MFEPCWRKQYNEVCAFTLVYFHYFAFRWYYACDVPQGIVQQLHLYYSSFFWCQNWLYLLAVFVCYIVRCFSIGSTLKYTDMTRDLCQGVEFAF